jgi:hypothetical protein
MALAPSVLRNINLAEVISRPVDICNFSCRTARRPERIWVEQALEEEAENAGRTVDPLPDDALDTWYKSTLTQYEGSQFIFRNPLADVTFPDN